jgi:hypothetical protein
MQPGNCWRSTISDNTEIVTVDSGGEPFTVTATLISMRRRTERGIFGIVVGLNAHLTVTVGATQRSSSSFLSRLTGEPDWIIDAEFGPTGFPHHSNGFAARYLKVRAIVPQLADLLDRQALRLGLVPAIGRDVPLVLPNDGLTTTPSLTDQWHTLALRHQCGVAVGAAPCRRVLFGPSAPRLDRTATAIRRMLNDKLGRPAQQPLTSCLLDVGIASPGHRESTNSLSTSPTKVVRPPR